ncbi:alpha/beta fold hydrolase [Mangrovihabitans endophyticus]|uniref:Putative hydrolase, alpha/beta fold protein n=1 Tax=Mangrovihabitans endophyticus TaxID=1751298 RepID=A0A8J3BXM7_9ACTN|nr:alpha/beta hydrolase [Mangrovihabitans endophyticus]GGK85019.1 putative hydrolase, alpha/beta fold protein [Mangrovihabitans endophyticus]
MPRAEFGSTRVESNGARLAYKRNGSGPPVLLIAPAGSRATIWYRYQVPALVGAGYQVVTYDQRGMPPTTGSGEPCDVATLSADAAVLIETLDLRGCRVVGASLGALVAQELAATRPELVATLALLGTRGAPDAFRTALARGQAEDLRHGPGGRLFPAVMSLPLLFAPGSLTDATFVEEWLMGLRHLAPQGEGPAAQFEATADYGGLKDPSAVVCPTLVVSFAHDVIMPPDGGADVAAAVRHGVHHVIADRGHFGFVEPPDLVSPLLIGFFAGGAR